MPPGATLYFQLNSGSLYSAPGSMNRRASASPRVSAIRAEASAAAAGSTNSLVSISLNCAIRERAHDLRPPAVHRRGHAVDLVERVVAVLLIHNCPETGSNAMPKLLRWP